MTELESFKLAMTVGLIGGLVGGLIFAVPVIIYRLIKKQRIFPEPKPINIPQVKGICIVGLILFLGGSIGSFISGRPIFGCFFLIFSMLYVIMLIHLKKKQNRANQGMDPTRENAQSVVPND